MQPVEPHREKSPSSTTTASGVRVYVHCNPITRFDAWGLETVEEYNEQIDEVDATLGEEYRQWRSEHYNSDNHDNEFNGWDSEENKQIGADKLKAVQDAKRPLQSARDNIINSVREFNYAFRDEIADGKLPYMDYTTVDDDYVSPDDLSDIAYDRNKARFCKEAAKQTIKYYAIAKALLSITGYYEYPGNDPTKPPPGTEWRGRPGSNPGDKSGNYYNPDSTESWRPDLEHEDPIGPHWDYRPRKGDNWWRVYPDKPPVPKP